MSQMAEDSELKCKAGRRPQKRNMQLWLQVCCEEGSSRSCLQQRLYQTTRNQWAQRSGLIELDLLNSACHRGREVTGIGRKMMKTKEKKNKQKSQAAMLWFCCNPSSIELCFSPHYVNKKNNSHKERQVPRIRAISH